MKSEPSCKRANRTGGSGTQKPGQQNPGRRRTLRRTSLISHDQEAAFTQRTVEFRDRMRQIGRLIRESFGRHRRTDPAVITRDAYRVVVSLIIDTLSQASEKVSTEELAAVSKMLAEQRKLDIAQLEIERKYPKPTAPARLSNGRDGPLPDRFSHVVTEIYGTNKSDDNGQDDDAQ